MSVVEVARRRLIGGKGLSKHELFLICKGVEEREIVDGLQARLAWAKGYLPFPFT